MTEHTDNKNTAPLQHYGRIFADSDPEALSARCGIPYENDQFRIRFFNRDFSLSWPEMELKDANGIAGSPSLKILLVRLLLEGTLIPSSGRFLPYREFPGGEVYITQFTGRCIRRLAGKYGNALPAFTAAFNRLGGRLIPGGDASCELDFLPELKIRLTIWEGDEEFPPNAQILFSDNFQTAFSAEDLAVVGDLLINALSKQ